MIYKGWTILAVLLTPRVYEVSNTGIKGATATVKYGKEVQFVPKLNPYNYQPYKYCAEKGDKYIEAKTIIGLKDKIDSQK